MRERYVVVLMCIGIATFIGLSVYTKATQDVIKPNIEIPEEEVTFEEGSDMSVLLAGVSASDNFDGDITDSVRVDSVITNDSETSATVTYAVYDSSNNVGKAVRIVNYVPLKRDTVIEDTEENSEDE